LRLNLAALRLQKLQCERGGIWGEARHQALGRLAGGTSALSWLQASDL